MKTTLQMMLATAWVAVSASTWAVEDAATPAAPAAPAVHVSNRAGIKMAADSARPMFVEFLGSPRLTSQLRDALTRAGHVMAADKASAEVIYELDGAYQALRPATGRSAEVRAGEFAENPGAVATKTGRGASVMVSLNPVAMLVGTLLSNVGDRSGARDGLNAASSGDPDGKCVAKCEGWVYRQRAVVTLTRIEGEHRAKASATAAWQDNAMAPAALLDQAAEALARDTGVPLRRVAAEASP